MNEEQDVKRIVALLTELKMTPGLNTATDALMFYANHTDSKWWVGWDQEGFYWVAATQTPDGDSQQAYRCVVDPITSDVKWEGVGFQGW